MASILTIGPIPAALVEAPYHIAPPDWLNMDPSDRALFRMAWAADVWHLTEDAVHTNNGPEIDRILGIAGVGPGNPWCASIWTAYLVDSGASRAKLPPGTASVHGWGDWAHAQKRFTTTPKRGFAGLIYHTATTGHLVVVTQVNGDSVMTIEGNTNLDGSRDGYGVFRRVRSIDQFAGFVDCTNLV